MGANVDRGTIKRNISNVTFDQRPVPGPWMDLGVGSKGQTELFQNMVMLHIKLKGITGAATWYQILCPHTPPPPPDPGSQNVKIQVFQNRVMLHIQLKTIANAVIWKQIFCPQPPLPDPVGQKVKFNFGRTWSCCISNERESQIQQYNSKYFARSPPPPSPQ